MVRHKLTYTPTDEPPYVPKAVLAQRLAAKTHPPTRQGCRLWFGAVRRRGDTAPEVGTMRLHGPKGSWLATVPTVAWYLAGHSWPRSDQWLRRTCGQNLCCTPEHLQLCKKLDRRKLTAAQVMEARMLFWGKDGRRQKLMPRSPERLVQDALGLDLDVVRRIVAGEHPPPDKGRRFASLSDQTIKEAYLDAVAACQVRRDKYAAAWTYARLAKKYNISLVSLQSAVNGLAYREVGGPTSAAEAAKTAAKQTPAAT